jgi:outer membrane protein assembly factor BamD (BamD/ComL family)
MSDELINSLRLRRAQLSEGIEEGTKQEFELALSDYRSLNDWNPTTAIHETPRTWLIKLANATYRSKDYPNAHKLYEDYRKSYPYSPAGDLMMLNQGKCLVMMKDYQSAQRIFEQQIIEFPEGKYVAKARKYTKS